MDRKQLRDQIRALYPNIPQVKRFLARKRIERFQRFNLSEDLVIRGERNLDEKREIVENAWAVSGKHLASLKKNIDKIFANAQEYKGRTDLDEVRTDMMFCRFAYGFQPDEYLCFQLEKKSPEERKQFISDIERNCFVFSANDIKDVQILNNKIKTYQRFQKYYQRDAVGINSSKDYNAFHRFVEKHPVFVKKAVFQSMGRSVERVDLAGSKQTERELFDAWIGLGPHILEEQVIQSQATAALNASSVNTVRCITLNTKHGVETLYTFMKIGRKGSFVDNGGAGGILVGIDKERGVFNTDGFDEYHNRYVAHPDSGVTFKGYQLPDWQQMLDMCKEMSKSVPSLKYIGWDMALSENGWVVIEGNGMSQFIGPQIVWERGIKSEIESYMKDMDLII